VYEFSTPLYTPDYTKITNIIPLYNIYSAYIEIRLVETISRDIYQNIVFPLFEILKIKRFGHITPEMFRNNNFVNKNGQKISFGRIHQSVGLVE
jgi:hypothetical protein